MKNKKQKLKNSKNKKKESSKVPFTSEKKEMMDTVTEVFKESILKIINVSFQAYSY